MGRSRLWLSPVGFNTGAPDRYSDGGWQPATAFFLFAAYIILVRRFQ